MEAKLNKYGYKDSIPQEIWEAVPDFVRFYIIEIKAHTHDLKRDLSLSNNSQEQLKQQVAQLLNQNKDQQNKIEELQNELQNLQARLNKDSTNSHKPPSSDGLKRKPKSLRVKTGKKPGGQPGHPGKHRAQFAKPTYEFKHLPHACQCCGLDLSGVESKSHETRQICDIPKPQVIVSQHQALIKECPNCGSHNKGTFPKEVKAPLQYGPGVKALTAYLTVHHAIPVKRTCQIFKDFYQLPISPGTCYNMSKQLAEVLLYFEEDVKKHLLNQPVLYFDESGLRCNNSLYWGHVAGNEEATLYQLNKKRGKEAMEAMGILVHYQGIAVHDEWIAYFYFKAIKHGLCNAHLLRELTYIEETHEESWAKQMKELLIQTKQKVEDYFEIGSLPEEELELIETRYHQIINEGLSYHSSLPSLARGKRGKAKQRPGKNLLDRMQKRIESVLLFMKNFQVEFTNNQSEREIRRLKVKQKVSGSFRTEEGGSIYLRICSYISTAHKQGWDILESLLDAARGSPRLLTAPT